jgi:hypothetical protein
MARNWGVESLRLTIFSPDTIPLSEDDWFVVTGEREAETRQNIPGGKRYMGKFSGGQLIVGAAGPRLDIYLSPQAPTEPTGSPSFPIIDEWDRVREAFVTSTRKWLAATKFPVTRLAFAAVLLSETKDRMESYVALKGLLKSVNVDPDAMREISFRVNWPIQSEVIRGLRLNRITNWNALQINLLLLQLSGQSSTTSASPAERFAIRLEMDHNTDEENKMTFEAEKLVPIYNELIGKACENAASGERP